jgi:hypothetical protein
MWSAFMSYIPRTIGDIECVVKATPPAAPAAHVTNLDIESCSAADIPASNENRIRAFSGPDGFLEEYARRFPVLRFLGMTRSLGDSVLRPRVGSSCMSWPAESS